MPKWTSHAGVNVSPRVRSQNEMPVPTNASLLRYLFASISASSVVGLILSTPLPSWPDDRLNATPPSPATSQLLRKRLATPTLKPSSGEHCPNSASPAVAVVKP